MDAIDPVEPVAAQPGPLDFLKQPRDAGKRVPTIKNFSANVQTQDILTSSVASPVKGAGNAGAAAEGTRVTKVIAPVTSSGVAALKGVLDGVLDATTRAEFDMPVQTATGMCGVIVVPPPAPPVPRSPSASDRSHSTRVRSDDGKGAGDNAHDRRTRGDARAPRPVLRDVHDPRLDLGVAPYLRRAVEDTRTPHHGPWDALPPRSALGDARSLARSKDVSLETHMAADTRCTSCSFKN